jgi:hypothetical protein
MHRCLLQVCTGNTACKAGGGTFSSSSHCTLLKCTDAAAGNSMHTKLFFLSFLDMRLSPRKGSQW